MSLSSNILLYVVLSLGVGYGLRRIRRADGSAIIPWQISGILIALACALGNAAMVDVNLPFGGTFQINHFFTTLPVDWPISLMFSSGFVTGFLIGLPIGLITAYDMSGGRFTFIDGWLLVFKVGIIFVVIGGTIASLSVPRYTNQQWFDFLIFGLAQGGIYALIALGYTLVYGILFMINFAHGEVFMAGAFTAFFAARALAEQGLLDSNPFISLGLIFLVATATSTIVAVLLERIAYRPLRRAPRLVPLITAIGASFFLQYTFRGFYGSGVEAYPDIQILQGDLSISNLLLFCAFAIIVVGSFLVLTVLPIYKAVKNRFPTREWVPPLLLFLVVFGLAIGFSTSLHPILITQVTTNFPLTEAAATQYEITSWEQLILPISRIQFVIIASSILLMAALYVVVQRTKIGKAMRAVAEDKDVAALMGIDVDKVITITFAMGAILAGSAGVLYALMFRQVHFFMGFLPGLKAFTAAVLGGIGNIPGAMIGGFFLGIFESLGPSLFLEGLGIPAAYQLKDVIAFTMLVLVLIFRPAGIMGVDLSKKKA